MNLQRNDFYLSGIVRGLTDKNKSWKDALRKRIPFSGFIFADLLDVYNCVESYNI